MDLVIVVSGGQVEAVYSDAPDVLHIAIVDYDKAGEVQDQTIFVSGRRASLSAVDSRTDGPLLQRVRELLEPIGYL